VIVSAQQCQTLGGVYQGDGLACGVIRCPPPPPRGACCAASPTNTGTARCIVTTQAQCQSLGGVYKGDGTVCSAVTCPRACPCDWNSDGFLTPMDLLAFVTDYTSNGADFNNDGQTTQQDLLDFIACFTNPPEGCRRP